MNKNKIKSYAPTARRAFIQAITDRAHFWGITENGFEPIEEKGDVAIVGGRPFPRKVAQQIRGLSEHIKREGFSQVMEEVAYTWFNRFMALRYMEIHGYFEHGFRVLSNHNGAAVPEILDKAVQVDLPGLNKQAVIDLKLDGGRDNELYRMLLVAQCNALSDAMPFLFERIDDETELLLPDNLLHADSLIRGFVNEIDEADWQEVEIIGWLYQFYISEKKDEVIGKVVRSEDIPAATQLFTPNWIVKYMVQNSLGRMWLAAYPNSPLRAKMEYYIEPAEQTDEVKAQLAAITPDSLDPEAITFLDPANGSGHILVEAYDLFKEIYQERGYRSRDIPRIILEKNLYGLDIDDRAAQMAGFAVLMKARKDDRTVLQSGKAPKLNIMAIQESEGIRVESIADALLKEKTYRVAGDEEIFPDERKQPFLAVKKSPEVKKEDLLALLDLFRYGKTFGSLIAITEDIAEKLPALKRLVDDDLTDGDLFAQQAAFALRPFVEQAMMLSRKYDCVVANPPYMGNRGMNSQLASWSKDNYPHSKSDLFAMFIERNLYLARKHRFVAMITMQSWMFLSSFKNLRDKIFDNDTILSMAHLGARAFDTIGGEVVSTTAFVLENSNHPEYKGGYLQLVDGNSESEKEAAMCEAVKNPTCNWFFRASATDFRKIPGSPTAYWVTQKFLQLFKPSKTLRNYGINPATGIQTGDNNAFIRCWFEVSNDKRGTKWFPLNDGGEVRKWYGNFISNIKWEKDGQEIRSHKSSVIRNVQYYFKEGATWNRISSAFFAIRYLPEGFIFDQAGDSLFAEKEDDLFLMMGFLNSSIGFSVMKIICPTLNATAGNLELFPYPINNEQYIQNIKNIVTKLIATTKFDWNAYEISWDFTNFPLLNHDYRQQTLYATYNQLRAHRRAVTLEMQHLEEENNRIFIEAYGLQDELRPGVPLNEITLTCNPRYRYGDNKNEDELETLLLADTVKEFISYAIGCMMGRYSLNQPGLVYAQSGNIDFDPSKYTLFPADHDGIIPIPDMEWFPDDAPSRFEEFLKVAWSPETLEENLKFVADSLSPKSGETPRETIRRYMSTQFFKDHLQTYKKRPIYWLFSSGKLRAFECLVYLHRYNEATLSRMRNEYVTPLQGKLSARIEYVNKEIDAAATTSARTKLQKQLDVPKKKQIELSAFDDLLRHYADQRISLDLDDGVKVNYGKFGALLAEVKTITGASE